MPSPYLYNRPSGRFVRVLVPSDLRGALGQRFFIRSLGFVDLDRARLLAAQWAVDLARYFQQIREGHGMSEPKKAPNVLLNNNKTADEKLDDYLAQITREVKAERLKNPQAFTEAYGLDDLAPPKPKRDRGEGPMLYAALMSYRRAKEASGTRPAYIQELMSAWEIWETCVGDIPIHSATDEDGRTFRDFLPKIPVNRNKAPALRNIGSLQKQVEKAKELGLPKISLANMDKLASRLRTFFDSLNELKRNNPLDGLSFTSGGQKKPKRVAFSQDDLIQIFDPKHLSFLDQPHVYWGLWIAVLTGARAREIGQLRLVDIKKDKTGIRYFEINDWGLGQSVKNTGSRRTVPIHSALIQMGFLDYMEDVKRFKGDLLFPTNPWHSKAGYGDAVGDRCLYFIRAKVGINQPEKVFHSFRYSAVMLLRNGGVPGDRIGAITGHSPSELDPAISKALGEVYMREVSLERKQKDINAMELPMSLWPAYRKGQFDRVFRRAIHQGKWCVKPGS